MTENHPPETFRFVLGKVSIGAMVLVGADRWDCPLCVRNQKFKLRRYPLAASGRRK